MLIPVAARREARRAVRENPVIPRMVARKGAKIPRLGFFLFDESLMESPLLSPEEAAPLLARCRADDAKMDFPSTEPQPLPTRRGPVVDAAHFLERHTDAKLLALDTLDTPAADDIRVIGICGTAI